MANRDTSKEGKSAVGNLANLGALFRYMVRYKGMVAGALTAMVLAAAAPFAIFRILQYVVDEGLVADDPSRIDFLFAVMLGVIVVMAVATAIRFRFVTLLGERVVADVRKDVHGHLIGMDPAFFEVNRPGEIASRLTADTTIIQNVVGSSASIALRNLFIFFGGVIMLLTINPKLLGLILLSVPLVAGTLVYFGRRVRKLTRSGQDRLAEVGAMADEAFSYIQVVQGFTQESQEKSRFSRAVESTFEAAVRRVNSRAWMTALIITVFSGAIALVLWQGAKNVLAETMSPGELASFVGIAILVAGAVGAISSVYGDIQRLAGAAGRIDELMAERPALKMPEHPITPKPGTNGPVKFESVSFSYPSKPGVRALKDVSFAIPPGKTIALVGPSGAGKTTVFQLLLRFFDPQKGRVTIAGIDVAQMDLKALRGLFSIVPQETVIFAETVLQNVRYGKPEATEREVRAALKDAQAWDFVETLSDGIHTFLGERGVRLSGGQRQRIAIARAILRNAPILLLDEATSALDSESERKVQVALKTLMKNRTTLVIAHRLSTVQEADEIIVLDGGRVKARGTHRSLIRKGGLYARLAKLQFNV